jgi:hypothetical protein
MKKLDKFPTWMFNISAQSKGWGRVGFIAMIHIFSKNSQSGPNLIKPIRIERVFS